jgi:hypothetical protein
MAGRVVIGEPALAVGNHSVLVLLGAAHGSIGQLAFAAVAEKKQLGGPRRFGLAAEAGDQMQGKILPGGSAAAGDEAVIRPRRYENALQLELHLGIIALKDFGGVPMRCRLQPVEQSGLCHQDRAGADRTHESARLVLLADPFRHGWPAAAWVGR